jgi:molybdopterin converting factor subunit 1
MGEKAGISSMIDENIVVKILFFAHLKELANTRQMEMSMPPQSTIHQLKESLIKLHPEMAKPLSFALSSLNHEYVEENQIISKNDEVGFFPPVSGGSDPTNNKVLITEDELDINLILRTLTTNETGAACIFTGFVRQDTKRGKAHLTNHLEYESYFPMAEAKMLQICDEIRGKWPLIIKIFMVQRLGFLLPGEVTTAIGCSSAHRDQGIFEAARFGIDRMKEIVPVWKKEIGIDGSEWVAGTYRPKPGE